MSELKISPVDMFNDVSKLLEMQIDGILVYVLKLSDAHGRYLAFPALDCFKPAPNICGKLIQTLDGSESFFINEISYDKYQGKVAIIKAYY